jgi:hypothetical protein
MAKTPQCPGRINSCADRGVGAIKESVGPMLLGIVKAKRVLKLCCGPDELAKIESALPERLAGF